MKDVVFLVITVKVINYIGDDIMRDILLLAVAAIFKYLNFIFEERYKARQIAIEKQARKAKQHKILIP